MKENKSAGRVQEEAASAPESTWLMAWVKTAAAYFAVGTTYLTAYAALSAILTKFPEFEGIGSSYRLDFILPIPLVLALFLNIIPTFRRRRERNLRPKKHGEQNSRIAKYFDTAPRVKDEHGFFHQGYERYLEWILEFQGQFLHLTGISGTGKSSLLFAYLLPELRKKEFRILPLRGYEDPLSTIKQALLNLDFWNTKPSDYDTIPLLEALKRANRQMGSGQRLIITFDQFEEYFILRSSINPNPGKKIDCRDDLKSFFSAFLEGGLTKVQILLVYREDYRKMVGPLSLPARVEYTNWMSVDPLDFSDATTFLTRGIKIPPKRLRIILNEASKYEGGRVLMRPIVANFLGIILSNMTEHPTLWREKDDLLMAYVKNCLGMETFAERTKILGELLTDYDTARPRSLEEISNATTLRSEEIDPILEHFSRAGLVRCVTPNISDASQRIWQISHDFIATLIDRVLARGYPKRVPGDTHFA